MEEKHKPNKIKDLKNEVIKKINVKQEVYKDIKRMKVENRHSSHHKRSQMPEKIGFHSYKVSGTEGKFVSSPRYSDLQRSQQKRKSLYKSDTNSHRMIVSRNKHASNSKSMKRQLNSEMRSPLKIDREKSKDNSISRISERIAAESLNLLRNFNENKENLTDRTKESFNQSYQDQSNDFNCIKKSKLFIRTHRHKSLFSQIFESKNSRSKVDTPDRIINSNISVRKREKGNHRKLQKSPIHK